MKTNSPTKKNAKKTSVGKQTGKVSHKMNAALEVVKQFPVTLDMFPQTESNWVACTTTR